MIGQNPKAEVATFFVSGNRYKEYQFSGRRPPWTHGRISSQTPGGKAERILDKENWCIQAKAVKKIPLVRKKRKYSQKEPAKKLSKH